jgi:hypothetical protein
MPADFSHDKQRSDGGFGHFGDCIERSCGTVRRHAVPDPMLFFSNETTKSRLRGRGSIGVNAALHECDHGPFPRRN